MSEATSTTAYAPFLNESLEVLLLFLGFLLRYVR